MKHAARIQIESDTKVSQYIVSIKATKGSARTYRTFFASSSSCLNWLRAAFPSLETTSLASWYYSINAALLKLQLISTSEKVTLELQCLLAQYEKINTFLSFFFSLITFVIK